MEVLHVQVNSPQNLEALTQFLKTINYVELVKPLAATGDAPLPASFLPGQFPPGAKPSAFAGIWKRKKRNAKTLRQKAWARKKSSFATRMSS